MKRESVRNIAAELAALDAKINALLPSRYQHCYTSVSPNSMGSAGLKYGPDGRVAWDEIWTTFCDLALAGGPPHRGKLLEPVSEADVAAAPGRYRDVVVEIGRAIGMTTCLRVVQGYARVGWVYSASRRRRRRGSNLPSTRRTYRPAQAEPLLHLPAGPDFRVEKEIKNVIVALIKANHYWDGHLTAAQQSLAGTRIWEPATPAEAAAAPSEYEAAACEVEDGLHAAGIPTSPRRYVGWVGVETASEEEAVWLLRAVLVEQVLARREERVLYLPVGATADASHAARVVLVIRQAWELRVAASPRRPWRP